MDQEMNRHTDPTGIKMALDSADGAAFLGDLNVVRGLVRQFAQDVVARIAEVQADRLDERSAVEADRTQAVNMGRIFAGQTPGFNMLPGWNDFGLPRWLQKKRRVGTKETAPEMIIAQAFGRMLLGIYDAFEQGGGDEAIAARIRAAVEGTTYMMLGIEGNE
ncbi:hypothetical protein NAD41_002382 [Salmonella enterica]|nr:hypothetical protein [Salmonella enterica]EKK6596350.1 hypothetical protein [Salmonella enterica]